MQPDSESFEMYRPLLFSIAYRMLGSAMEAEDMVQETFIRYQQAAETDIRSLKAYLTTVITRLCLDGLKSAKNRRETYVGTWLPEPLLTGESPDMLVSEHESIAMAFMVLLESLTPIERAIFLLRDVFDYSYAEIAAIVDKSEANCRRYYHHAKQYIVERRPRFEPSPAERKNLVEEFLHAVATGDLDGLTRLLAEDVMLYGDGGGKAPAFKKPLTGRAAVLRLMLAISRAVASDDVQIEMKEVNGFPALLFRLQGKLYFVMNFTLADGQIAAIYNILNPDKFAHLSRLTDTPGSSGQQT
jgi:RNA polymerase sigma-70 factor, ECF subfamily